MFVVQQGLKGLLSTAVSLTIDGNIILNLEQTQIIRYGLVMTEFLNTNTMSCHHIKYTRSPIKVSRDIIALQVLRTDLYVLNRCLCIRKTDALTMQVQA